MHSVPLLQVLISSPPPPFSAPAPPYVVSLAPSLPTSSPFQPLAASFRPSIAVIIGVLTTMFSLTFLLLLYAKHCKRNIGIHDRIDDPSIAAAGAVQALPLMRGRNSGVDVAIIDSLPTFSFVSLHGQKEGLECAVCLSCFNSSDILRLLPKCKHAFHLECVDTWLRSHSSCPLCRNRVEADDVLTMEGLLSEAKCLAADEDRQQLPRNSGAGRVSSSRQSVNVDGFHLHVQREGDNHGQDLAMLSSTSKEESVSRSGSRRGKLQGVYERKDALLQLQAFDMDKQEFARRFQHRIIISGSLSQHRWSDFVPSDAALFLSSQAIFAGLNGKSTAEPVASATCSVPSPAQLQPPRRSGSSVPARQDVFLSCMRTSGRAQVGLLDAAGDGDLEIGRKPPKWRALRPPDTGGRMPSYRRSVSEVSGMRRYVDSNKSPVLTSEETKQWFSVARKTLTWMMGANNGRPLESDL